MFFYVYVLQSLQHDELYIGCTHNLIKRIEEHNRGLVQSTRPYLPWHLIYYEACLHEKDGQRREKYFKGTQGRRLLKLRLKEYFFKRRK